MKDKIPTISGDMEIIYFPAGFGFDDPKKVAEAFVMRVFDLSVKKVKTLDYHCYGYTYEKIAELIGKDRKTIYNWNSDILFKMGASSLEEACAMASKLGLGPSGEEISKKCKLNP